jgi:predicted nucleotidyltransferase
MPADVEKILNELKQGLVRIHGDRIKAIYLFGSFARGEGRLPDSDIDVMVVLRGDFITREMENRSIDFVSALCLKYDVVIMCHFISDDRFTESKMPFMLNVRREAVSV